LFLIVFITSLFLILFTGSALLLSICKETYYKANETYYKAKETYYKAKETYHKAKEIYNSGHLSHTSATGLPCGARGSLLSARPEHEDCVAALAVLRCPRAGGEPRLLSAGFDALIKVWS